MYRVKKIADVEFIEEYNVTSETSECLSFAIKITVLGKGGGTHNWKLVQYEEGRKLDRIKIDTLLLSTSRASNSTRRRT